MIFLVLGVVGGAVVAAAAAKAANEAGLLGTPYRPRNPPPPRVGYS